MKLDITKDPGTRWAIAVLQGEFDTFNLPAFCDTIDELARTHELLILDLRNLKFINSAALGFLIKLAKRTRSRGGTLLFSNPSPYISKTLVVQGLADIFPVIDEADVARATSGGLWTEFECPIHGCAHAIRRLGAVVHGLVANCPGCGARFELATSRLAEHWAVSGFVLPTYEGESIQISRWPYEPSRLIDGRGSVGAVRGRLDMFAGEILGNSWMTVPPPRRLIWDLSEVTTLTADGIQSLISTTEPARSLHAWVGPDQTELRDALIAAGTTLVPPWTEDGKWRVNVEAPQPLLVRVRSGLQP